LENLGKCLDSGILASGPMVKEFEAKWKAISVKKFNVGFNSGSSAAAAIFAFLKEKYGPCEVYAPSLSFSSPVWAAKQCGHEIGFVDVSTKNFCTSRQFIDKAMAPHASSSRKRVVFPLLYGGISSIDVQEPSEETIIVVDSCHTVNPRIESDYIFFSFHPVKPVAMANGGLVSTDDEAAAEYFLRFRNFGRSFTDVSYDVVQPGFNSYMNDLNAAIGLAQLDHYEQNIERRKKIAKLYDETIDQEKYDIVQHIDPEGRSSYYLYTIVAKELKRVDRLVHYLRSEGIETLIHYPLIHKLTYFRTEGQPVLENSERVEGRFLNIPCHASMTPEDAKFVAEAVNSYSEN
jgi:dTDP-4-amino-4,6-dideoxygalactose transaminase